MALSHSTILLDSDIEGTRKPDARALHVEPHDPEEEERADPAFLFATSVALLRMSRENLLLASPEEIPEIWRSRTLKKKY